MVKKLRSFESLRSSIDILDAVKRAMMQRGFIRQPKPINPKKESTKQSKTESAHESGLAAKRERDIAIDATPSKNWARKTDPKEMGEAEDEDRSEDKNKPEEKKDDQQKLSEVAEKAHEVLYKVDTVFPFTLFPSTVTVEREKVNIAARFFFRVAKITHIPVRDLLGVEADVGPFFGSVHITSRFFMAEPFTVNYLWRKDALQLQTLLQGYIIAYERDIDATSIEKDKLIELLNNLGVGDSE